jgi:hypothetical protein
MYSSQGAPIMNGDHRALVVTLTVDLPERGLRRGQAGTVVESLSPDIFNVAFVDHDGRPCATVPVNTRHLLVVHY